VPEIGQALEPHAEAQMAHRILLVDDSDLMLRLGTLLLSGHYEVITAGSAPRWCPRGCARSRHSSVSPNRCAADRSRNAM
jgi:hypothetical protein